MNPLESRDLDPTLIIRVTLTHDLTPAKATRATLGIKELYTAMWLFTQGRIDDMHSYQITKDRKFEEETGARVVLNQEITDATDMVKSGSTIELHMPIGTTLELVEKIKSLITPGTQSTGGS